jgi:uncharacterized membrane protein (DUF373 family)
MDESPSADESAGRPAAHDPHDRIFGLTGRFVSAVELAAAALFALLFGIGVVDLALQIAETVPTLLLIIVEVYETVVAYIEQSETRRIVRLVIYTGVIAMVRKVIIYRTGEYETAEAALFAAVSYTIVLFGLVALLYVERSMGPTIEP